jgi:general secretion pathway protein K
LKKPLSRQQGTAIIVALFITALVAAAAIAMIERMRTDIYRTELLLNNIQANQYAAGSLYWAMDQLTTDWKQQQPKKIIDRTPIRSPVNEVKGAKISSIIFDGQGKINLNNLTDAQFQTLFIRLLQLVQPNLDKNAAQNITLNIANWIMPGLNNTQTDQYYAKLNPPYRAPHRPMVSVSELRLVKDITPALYAKLLPYVTALPEKTQININNAPLLVIMSFSPEITLEIAKAFIAFRQATPLGSLDALSNFPIVKNNPIAQNNLTVSSSYFMVQTHVILDKQQTTYYTLLMRVLKNSQPVVMIVWQSKGTL